MAIADEVMLWIASSPQQFEAFSWCCEQFGEPAKFRDQVEDSDGKRWIWTSMYNYAVFHFANEADATLFRLKWL